MAGMPPIECAVIDEASTWLHDMMHDPCSHACMHALFCPVLYCVLHSSKSSQTKYSHAMLQPPVAQSAPLYPSPHYPVHAPVVPPGVPCVESQTIVPAVMPLPAVHALAADPHRHHIIHGEHATRRMSHDRRGKHFAA